MTYSGVIRAEVYKDHGERDESGDSLGGRSREDETISLQVFPTHEAPMGQARDKARRKLMARIDRTAAHVSDILEAEVDAAIDEVTDYVRHHPE